MDASNEEIYAPFLICEETGSPLTFPFRESTNENYIPCAVAIDEQTFDSFEIYLHNNSPRICRLQSLSYEGKPSGQIFVNFVGDVRFSYLNIEPKLDFIVHFNQSRSGFVEGGMGYTLERKVPKIESNQESNLQRIQIGDEIQFEISVKYVHLVN